MIITRSARPLALALAAATLATSAAIPAQAAEPQQGIAVQYRDLDLTNETGQRVLEERLDHAARHVCGMDDRITGSRLPSRNSAKCYNETKAQLAEQIARLVGDENRGG